MNVVRVKIFNLFYRNSFSSVSFSVCEIRNNKSQQVGWHDGRTLENIVLPATCTAVKYKKA